jgi:hypothetical protein
LRWVSPARNSVSLIHALLDFGTFVVHDLLQTRLFILVHGQLTMNDTQGLVRNVHPD